MTCTLPFLAAGCGLLADSRYEKVWTGPREPGKRYLDKNEVLRCFIVVTSDPDGCDLEGVARDRHIPLGRTPARYIVDVRVKEYSDHTRDVQVERINESRNRPKIEKQTGILFSDWHVMHLSYLFTKVGYVNKRFEEERLSAEGLVSLPDSTFKIHATLDPETLELKPHAPTTAVPAGRATYEVDVRLVEVQSGRANSATTGQAGDVADFRAMADGIVFELTERLNVPERAKVAVLDLEAIGQKTSAGQYGMLIARMLSTSLINTGKFDVVERQQLDKLLKEQDLTAAEIAASPGEMGKILGLDYVVLGSVAKVR